MSDDCIERAIHFIDIAVAADTLDDYKFAFDNYVSALEWLELAIKHSITAKTANVCLKSSVPYLERAEKLKKYMEENKKRRGPE